MEILSTCIEQGVYIKVARERSCPLRQKNFIKKGYDSAEKRFIMISSGVLERMQWQDEIPPELMHFYIASGKVFNSLSTLANNKNNCVIICGSTALGMYQSEYSKLNDSVGICSEHGQLFKHPFNAQLEQINSFHDWSWKILVRGIMEKYVEETPGSSIVTGEYSVKWGYEDITVKEICQEQERELANHLRQVFGGLKKIEIKEGEGVEVKPEGVNWKIFLQITMEKLWEEQNGLDFIFFAVTEEESDMIQAVNEIKNKLGEDYKIPWEREFLCVVGIDNIYANCYLNSKEEVYQILQELGEGEKNFQLLNSFN